jgi:hypothetical protein
MVRIDVKYFASIAAVVVLGSMLAMAQQSGMHAAPVASAEQGLTGTVTCSGRITHLYTCQKNQTLQGCTLDCAARGSQFVLLVGDKPYTLDVSRNTIQDFAGGKATVIGQIEGDRFYVRTVINPKRKTNDSQNGE